MRLPGHERDASRRQVDRLSQLAARQRRGVFRRRSRRHLRLEGDDERAPSGGDRHEIVDDQGAVAAHAATFGMNGTHGERRPRVSVSR